jgi:hypothetical protein
MTPDFEGQARWLLRMLLPDNLWVNGYGEFLPILAAALKTAWQQGYDAAIRHALEEHEGREEAQARSSLGGIP